MIDIGVLLGPWGQSLVEHADRQEICCPDFTQSHAELCFAHLYSGQTNAGGILPGLRDEDGASPETPRPDGAEGRSRPLPEPGRLFPRDGQRRDVVQRGLKGNEVLVSAGLSPHFIQLGQRQSTIHPERADAGPAQRGDVPFGSQRCGEITHQRPDIKAFSTPHENHGEVRAGASSSLWPRRTVTMRGASSTCFAFARQVIGALSAHLHCRELRRHLFDLADEALERFPRSRRAPGRTSDVPCNLALAVLRRGPMSPSALVKT